MVISAIVPGVWLLDFVWTSSENTNQCARLRLSYGGGVVEDGFGGSFAAQGKVGRKDLEDRGREVSG